MQLGSPPVNSNVAAASLMLVAALETVSVFSSLSGKASEGKSSEMRLAASVSLGLNGLASILAGSIWPLIGAVVMTAVLMNFYQRAQAEE